MRVLFEKGCLSGTVCLSEMSRLASSMLDDDRQSKGASLGWPRAMESPC